MATLDRNVRDAEPITATPSAPGSTPVTAPVDPATIPDIQRDKPALNAQPGQSVQPVTGNPAPVAAPPEPTREQPRK